MNTTLTSIIVYVRINQTYNYMHINYEIIILGWFQMETIFKQTQITKLRIELELEGVKTMTGVTKCTAIAGVKVIVLSIDWHESWRWINNDDKKKKVSFSLCLENNMVKFVYVRIHTFEWNYPPYEYKNKFTYFMGWVNKAWFPIIRVFLWFFILLLANLLNSMFCRHYGLLKFLRSYGKCI